MAVKIIWSTRTAQNLEDICIYIEQDSAHYARLFAQRILSEIEQLTDFPESGRIVPEYNNPVLRGKIMGNYRIIYRIKKDAVEIAAIVHGARLLKL